MHIVDPFEGRHDPCGARARKGSPSLYVLIYLQFEQKFYKFSSLFEIIGREKDHFAPRDETNRDRRHDRSLIAFQLLKKHNMGLFKMSGTPDTEFQICLAPSENCLAGPVQKGVP